MVDITAVAKQMGSKMTQQRLTNPRVTGGVVEQLRAVEPVADREEKPA